MIERRHRTLTFAYVLVDAVASCLALIAAYWLRFAVELISDSSKPSKSPPSPPVASQPYSARAPPSTRAPAAPGSGIAT